MPLRTHTETEDALQAALAEPCVLAAYLHLTEGEFVAAHPDGWLA
jgi:hypothetical protein